MKIRTRQPVQPGEPGVAGTIRTERRTSAVLRKAQPGDIVVLDHLDLDRASAEALVAHRVAAVVNASPFISGRFPNLGPEVLAKAGVVLLDGVGTEVFGRVRDGVQARVADGRLYVGANEVAAGHELSLEEVQSRMGSAREGLATQLQSFTHNTTEFLRREQDLLLHGQGVPDLRTPIADRPVVVVVRDFDYQADLKRLRGFVKEQRPVLIGVDGGADALLEVGLKPDLVLIGESGFAATDGSGHGAPTGAAVSDKALRTAREIVVHADASDRAVGSERLDRLGIRPHRMSASGTTEDMALLLADVRGASVIVTVGTHATLDEFLDARRAGLASTFLTRLRVGPRVVDAATVPVLYSGRVRLWQLLLVLLVGLVALAVAIGLTPRGEVWFDDLRDWIDPALDRLQGLFS